MATAYVDTSCILALVFAERTAPEIGQRIAQFETLIAANLLEAELLAAFVREKLPAKPSDAPVFTALEWITPDRPLHDEISRTLAAGYVRGADCWHIAVALFAASELGPISFLTLDVRQREVAAALGFAT